MARHICRYDQERGCLTVLERPFWQVSDGSAICKWVAINTTAINAQLLCGRDLSVASFAVHFRFFCGFSAPLAACCKRFSISSLIILCPPCFSWDPRILFELRSWSAAALFELRSWSLPQVQFEDTFGTFHHLKAGSKVKLTGVLNRGGTLLPVCFVGE